MTTPEDKLAALLRAVDIPTRGDGLSRIQARLVRRKRARWIVPVAALATAGVAATVLVLAGDPGRDTLTITPASPSAAVEPSATGEPSGAPSPTAAPCPTPVVGTAVCSSYEVTSDTYDGPFIWPDFGSDASLDTVPWAKDPMQVAQRFVTEWLRLTGLTVGPGTAGVPGQGMTFPLRVAGRDVSLLTLEPQKGMWVVTQAGNVGGRVEAPGFGESVTSPLEVRGTLDQAVDDNVRLTLLTSYRAPLAETSAPAGSAVPWSGTLAWTNTEWSRGAVVGITTSNKDGSLTRLFAQPVVRATASQVATFAGIVDGHVEVLPTDGSTGMQLTFPPAGFRDVEASFNGTSALVHRHLSNRGSCGDSLIRIDGQTASTVAQGDARLSTPRLAPSGTWEAWSTTPCRGGASSVALRQGDRPVRFLTVPDGQSVAVAGVRDDGALLLQVGDGKTAAPRLLSPGETDVAGGHALAAAAVCGLTSAAFDGARVVAWESCGGKVHLVRYDGNGARVSVDPDVLTDPPQRTSVNNGRLLVWLFGGDSVGEVARYQDGRLTPVVKNTGCTSVSEPKGCVRDPSW